MSKTVILYKHMHSTSILGTIMHNIDVVDRSIGHEVLVFLQKKAMLIVVD